MAKQLSLDIEGIEDKECDKPLRLLYKPSTAEQVDVYNTLSRETKEDLQIMGAPFLALIKKYRFRFDCGNGKTETPMPIALFEKTKTHPKEAWVQLLTLFYNEHNYNIIFDNMPKREIDVWRKVLRNHFLADTDVEDIMGEKCFKESRWYSERMNLTGPLSYHFHTVCRKGELEEDGYFQRYATYLYIGYTRQQMLLKEFFPDLADVNGIERLPEDCGLNTYSGESLILTKLPVLASIYSSKMLPRGFAKQTAAAVKKVQKLLVMSDFFKTYPDAKQPPLSTALMLNNYLFFREYNGRKKLPEEPENLVKAIIDKVFSFNAYTLPVLLPYLKGIKKKLLDSSLFDFVMETLRSILKDYHEKGWLAVDSLIMKIRTYDMAADSKFVLIDPYNIDDMELRNGYNNDLPIHLGNIIKQVSEPYVKAMLFMLSTFGIVEIAYREPTDGDTSYYDGLQYVRLTELGKYAFGITDSYMPLFTEDNDPAFELDSQRLLIKVLRADTPFIPLLKDFAESITPSLYRVSYDSFLKGCTNATSVKQKVKLFRQYICSKQPAVWKQFFKEVEERINPFSSPDSQYTLMRLSPDDRELQRLVLTEPSIRKYVLKAENYMILVKTDEMKQFANALRKFGYLI